MPAGRYLYLRNEKRKREDEMEKEERERIRKISRLPANVYRAKKKSV